MDELIQDMINKGLASAIPVWFAALTKYNPDKIYWMEWLRLNSN